MNKIDKKKDNEDEIESLKIKLRKRLVALFHHPGTPIEDKKRLGLIIKLIEL